MPVSDGLVLVSVNYRHWVSLTSDLVRNSSLYIGAVRSILVD